MIQIKAILFSFLIFFICSDSYAVQADSANADKRFLLELLVKRKALFNKYSRLEQQKTGIFKSKSKKDIRASKDMLNSIISLDNRIISELDRLFEHKQFEKLSLGVDMIDYELQLNRQKEGIHTLQNEVKTLRLQNEKFELEISQGIFWKYLFLFLLLVLAAVLSYMLFRRKPA